MSTASRPAAGWVSVVRGVAPGWWLTVVVGVSCLSGSLPGQAADPVRYRLAFPAPEHRWAQVEVVFPALDPGPLVARMSSASPGRYARHEFAKNIIDLRAFDGSGAELGFRRPAPQVWTVPGHDGTVRLTYRIFGDRIDGTYLAVDSTHAHLNMPATLMWAEALADRPVRVRFEPPVETEWRVATQLFPTDDPREFTAPNLQYLLDSPAEISDFLLRTFVVPDPGSALRPTFRVAIHHDGTGDGVEAFVASVEAIVREMVGVFGEFPAFETNTYTFIADYLGHASGDAMEHRNSTVLTARGRLDTEGQRVGLLGSVAHEFFHVWNVERIRPRSLEPFDFSRANISGELWLAEGFTNYYGKLVMARAGVASPARTLASFGRALDTVIMSPGRRLNSAVDMSRMAPFTDAATAIDRTNFGNTFLSYYTWGEAIALGLDLTLRARTGGSTTLDDYMRALWVRFGKPGGSVPGVVDRPYTIEEARSVLGEVAGDPSFATDFFTRFIEGREVVDYAVLLDRAGLVLRRVAPDRPTLGRVQIGSGLVVAGPTSYGSPLHEAGVDRDDVLTSLAGERLRSARDLARVLGDHRPGDTLTVGFERRGVPVESTLTVAEDPRVELVTLESTGRAPTSEQMAFREAWLSGQG